MHEKSELPNEYYERFRRIPYVQSFDSETREFELRKIGHRATILQAAEEQGIDISMAEAQGLSPSEAGLLDLLPEHIGTQSRSIEEIALLTGWPARDSVKDIKSWFSNFEIYDLIKQLPSGTWQLTGWGRKVAPRVFEDTGSK